jgi:hypothetical protein
MLKAVNVKSLGKYRIWLRYEDGTEGTVDLSDFAGKGVFTQWDTPGLFDGVTIDESGAVVWSEAIDLCPDMLYMRLTGKTPEEVFPNLKESVPGKVRS